MILLDTNQIMISSVFAMHGKKINHLTINEIRHAVLKGIMYYNHRFRNDYGDMVLCYDSHNYWRTELFPNYKAARKTKQQSSDIDWSHVYRLFDIVKKEIADNFKYASVEIPRLEADDIISVISSEYHGVDKILIVSADKDFQQLQKYSSVDQYSPARKDMLVCEDPEGFLIEHTIRGDSSDGVPNVLSDSDTFVTEGKKQKIMNAKRYNNILSKVTDGTIYSSEYADNFKRNEDLINMDKIPSEIKQKVIAGFKKAVDHSNGVEESKMMDFLVANRLNSLLEELDKFQHNLEVKN